MKMLHILCFWFKRWRNALISCEIFVQLFEAWWIWLTSPGGSSGSASFQTHRQASNRCTADTGSPKYTSLHRRTVSHMPSKRLAESGHMQCIHIFCRGVKVLARICESFMACNNCAVIEWNKSGPLLLFISFCIPFLFFCRSVSASTCSHGPDTSQHMHTSEDAQRQPQPQAAVHGERLACSAISI